MNWQQLRAAESDGFVAKRLLGHLLLCDGIILGTACAQNYMGKYRSLLRYVRPEDIVIYHPKV